MFNGVAMVREFETVSQRAIELKCYEYREVLVEQQYDAGYIDVQVARYGECLRAGNSRLNEIQTFETHKRMLEQYQRNERIREAFGLPRSNFEQFVSDFEYNASCVDCNNNNMSNGNGRDENVRSLINRKRKFHVDDYGQRKKLKK